MNYSTFLHLYKTEKKLYSKVYINVFNRILRCNEFAHIQSTATKNYFQFVEDKKHKK